MKIFRDTAGAAMIEMALLFPLLVLLTFGAVQVALISYALSSMQNAARASARAISVGEADDETNGTANDLCFNRWRIREREQERRADCLQSSRRIAGQLLGIGK